MEIMVLSKFWYWFLILTVVGLSAGIFSYKTSYPPLGRFWSILLATFRGIAIFLLGLLLIEPLINIQSDKVVKSRLAVLIDDTKSMGIMADGVSRIVLADSLVSGELSALKDPYDLFNFSGDKIEINNLPGIKGLSGDATSISGALEKIESMRNFSEFGAILLVTDGRHNLGSDPVDQAVKSDVPVYTLTVGRESAENNISISYLNFPAVAYSGDRFKIEAEISARGMEDRKSRVFIKEGEKIIDSKLLDVPSAGRNVKVEFEIEAPDPGNIEYKISTPVLGDETRTEDNERIIVVRVLKSKIKVFFGASSLDWEFKFIKQALEKFEEFDVSAVFPEAAGRFSSPGVPRGLEGLNQYDVIILVDCSPGDLRISIGDLKSAVAGSKSLIYIAGDDFNSDIRDFENLLPLELRNISTDDGEFFYVPAHKFRQHAAIALNEDPDESDKLWNLLPPLSAAIAGLKVTGETLLEARTATGSALTYPVLTIGTFENGRVSAITAFPVWRSYFGSANDNRLSGVIPRFWRNFVRWSASTEIGEKFKIHTDQKVYRLGETIKFTAYLNDESNAPKNGALVTISIRPQSENVKVKDVVLTQSGAGTYTGDLNSPGAGKYGFTALALSSGDTLGKYSGEFTVESYSLETALSSPDYELTRRIAEATGGVAYNVDNMSDFSQDLILNPNVETELSQIRPFGMPLILAFALILLCAEWALRKKFRLP